MNIVIYPWDITHIRAHTESNDDGEKRIYICGQGDDEVLLWLNHEAANSLRRALDQLWPPEQEPADLDSLANNYADAHAADPGHNLDVGLPMEAPAAPKPHRPLPTSLADWIFNEMTDLNRAWAEHYRQQGPQ